MTTLPLLAALLMQAGTQHAGNATRLMQDRHFIEAATEFEQALRADPNNDGLRIQYATCLFAAERNDDARAQFEQERKKLGDRSGLLYFLGILDLRAEDFSSAIRRLQPLAADPAFPKASFYLGLAYLNSGQTTPALESLERAAKNNPHDSEVHYRLARAYAATAHATDADREFKAYREARETERFIEEQAPACITALHQHAPTAQAVCQKLADPKDPRRQLFLGQLYAQSGAFEDALEPLRAAASADPESFDAWHYLGLTLFGLHRYPEALPPLQNASALNPQYFDTLNLLANTLHFLGNDAAALPILERAHALNPDDARINAELQQLRVKH